MLVPFRYANHLLETNRLLEAVELYSNAGQHLEAFNLLNRAAEELQSNGAPPHVLKKAHVLAALEIQAFRNKMLGTSTATTNPTLAESNANRNANGNTRQERRRSTKSIIVCVCARVTPLYVY